MTSEQLENQTLPAEQAGLVRRVGPLTIDVPKSIGYFGGIALAVALEVIEWPVGVFIAAVPLVKMLSRPDLPTGARFASEVFDGMAKPVGGDAEGTIQLQRTPRPLKRAARTAAQGRGKGRRASPPRTPAASDGK